MINLSSTVEAVRQLNQTWKYSIEQESERIPNDLYNAMCDIDEAISNLIEKVGEGTRAITLYKIKQVTT